MQGDHKHGMQCPEFEALLTDALDGVMAGAELEQFRTHAREGSDCGPLFAHAQQGMKMLRALPELAPPGNLVHNILASTSMGDARAPVPAVPAVKHGPWQRGG